MCLCWPLLTQDQGKVRTVCEFALRHLSRGTRSHEAQRERIHTSTWTATALTERRWHAVAPTAPTEKLRIFHALQCSKQPQKDDAGSVLSTLDGGLKSGYDNSSARSTGHCIHRFAANCVFAPLHRHTGMSQGPNTKVGERGACGVYQNIYASAVLSREMVDKGRPLCGNLRVYDGTHFRRRSWTRRVAHIRSHGTHRCPWASRASLTWRLASLMVIRVSFVKKSSPKPGTPQNRFGE